MTLNWCGSTFIGYMKSESQVHTGVLTTGVENHINYDLFDHHMSKFFFLTLYLLFQNYH